MVKYVVLKSRVPTTYDGGFRAQGYDVVEIVEVDKEHPDLTRGIINRIIDGEIKLASVKSAKRDGRI